MTNETPAKPKRFRLSRSAKILIATVFVTLGVYFSFPEKGLVATLPVMFFFSFVAWLALPEIWFSLAGGGVALFYGVTASLVDPALFAFISLIGALCGILCARFLYRFFGGSRWKNAALFLLCLAFGASLPLFYTGSPAAFERERERALTYLETTYPEQEFTDMVFRYDRQEKAYRATVSYPNGENTLKSDLVFKDPVEDGYLADYGEYVLIRHKAAVIEAFLDKDLSVITDEGSLLIGPGEPVPGRYGELDESILPLTHFCVTFREEKPDRMDFADSIAEALNALSEKDVTFGKITFYALDAGNVVYRCDVLPDTPTDRILSLITYNR